MRYLRERMPVPRQSMYKIGATVLSRVVLKARGGFVYQNAEVLDSVRGPYVITPTHRSWLDIPAVATSVYKHNQTQVHFMAKDEFWISRVKGAVLSATGAFPIDRESGTVSEETIRHIDTLVKNNAAMCIFPEGGIKSGELRRANLKRGVGMFALMHGLTLVPTGISGVETKCQDHIGIAFGEPIQVKQVEIDPANPRSVVRSTKAVLDELYEGLSIAQLTAESL